MQTMHSNEDPLENQVEPILASKEEKKALKQKDLPLQCKWCDNIAQNSEEANVHVETVHKGDHIGVWFALGFTISFQHFHAHQCRYLVKEKDQGNECS